LDELLAPIRENLGEQAADDARHDPEKTLSCCAGNVALLTGAARKTRDKIKARANKPSRIEDAFRYLVKVAEEFITKGIPTRYDVVAEAQRKADQEIQAAKARADYEAMMEAALAERTRRLYEPIKPRTPKTNQKPVRQITPTPVPAPNGQSKPVEPVHPAVAAAATARARLLNGQSKPALAKEKHRESAQLFDDKPAEQPATAADPTFLVPPAAGRTSP
jgi:hypothetical protein